MAVESDIFTLLGPLVGNRVFPDVAPIKTPCPYITYQQVGGQAPSFLGREVPSKENGYFQVNVWAESRAQAKALIKQVEYTLVVATVFQAKPMSGVVSNHDPDLNRYGSIQDFNIWADR